MSSPTVEDSGLAQPTISRGWLRGAVFDLNFILIIAAIAITSGLLAAEKPNWFLPILVLDLWLLGFHHVEATFTRLIFDAESFRQNRFLIIQLPLIVIAVTIGLVMWLGAWVVPTAYFYWQWFHYTRQSYGIERVYRRKAPAGALINDRLIKWSLYLVPLYGILYRSYQEQKYFLGMKVNYITDIDLGVWGWTIIINCVGIAAAITLTAWAMLQAIALLRGELAFAHSLYLLSHHLIFLTGYVLITDINAGWLVLNIWHNAQYILFVWMFNNNRFKDGVDQNHRFLSTLSQTRYAPAYFGLGIAVSSAIYFGLNSTQVTTSALFSGSPWFSEKSTIQLTLLISMVVNFHHYVVDGMIWKVRKPAIQKNLNINSQPNAQEA